MCNYKTVRLALILAVARNVRYRALHHVAGGINHFSYDVLSPEPILELFVLSFCFGRDIHAADFAN